LLYILYPLYFLHTLSIPTTVNSISELRQDLVSGEWVVVATGRARRPDDFARAKHPITSQPPETCPFETLHDDAKAVYAASGERLPPGGEDRERLRGAWWLEVVPNKYPAFGHDGECAVVRAVGPYRFQDGVGAHEVVVTRDHARSVAHMSPEEVAVMFRAYRDRYLALKDEDCVEYISIFHNHGADAGASLDHPHSQIIAISVIPPDISRSLAGSAAYFGRTGKCVHCTMIEFDAMDGRRIIYENQDFVVSCPFAPRQAFEVRVFPKRHAPYFEILTEREIALAGDALRQAIARFDRALAGPAYNFFIHTAPTADGPSVAHYHWHLEIIPKTAVWAGFEIGTGIEISTISPEAAAGFLREIRI